MEQVRSTKPRSEFLREAVFICGGSAAFLGVLALIGWFSGMRLLASFSLAYLPMSPDSAIVFIVFGLILVGNAHNLLPDRYRLLLALVVAVAFGYGLLKFSEYFAKTDLTFETIWFPITDKFGSFPVGRMSPITGEFFLLSGTALLLLLWDKTGAHTRNLGGAMGLLVCLAGFVATTGYLFGTPLLYGGDMIPVAEPTAIAFLLLGVGLVAAAGPTSVFVRPLVGASVRARMLRAFLPLTATMVLIQALLDKSIIEVSAINHALAAAAFSLVFMLITAAVVTQVSGVISHTLDRAEGERQRAVEALAQERNLLRTLIDNLPDQISVKDTEGHFILNNQSDARIRGAMPAALLGKTDLAIYPVDLATRYAAQDQAVIQSGKAIVDHEEYSVTPSGTEHWALITKVPLRDRDGRISGVLGIKREITERKQAEAALKQSEERYRDLFENATDLIQSVTPDGRFLYVNPAWRDMLGYDEEEISRLSLFEIIHPDYRARCVDLFQQLLAGVEMDRIETAFVSKEGRKLSVEGRVSCKFNRGYPIATRGIFRDVTERQKMEAALRISEAKYRSLYEAVDAGVIFHSPYGKVLEMNARAREILGVETGPEPGKPSPFSNWRMVHEDGSPFFRQEEPAMRLLLGGRPVRNLVMGFVPPAGECRWVLVNATPMIEPNGQFRGFISTFMDLTTQRQAEAARAQLAAIVESSEDAIISETSEGLVTSWNRAAEKLYGYSAQEIIGQPISLLGPSEHSAVVYETLNRIKSGERVNYFEAVHLRKDGTAVEVSLTTSPIRNDAGVIIGASTIAHDIMERKQAEARLARHAREAAALFETTRDLSGIQHDLSGLLETIVKRAVGLLQAGSGSIFLYDAERQDLEIVVTTGPELPLGTHFALGEGMAGCVAQTRAPLLVEDYRRWEHRSRQVGEIPFSASVEVPMLYGGQLVGVLAVNEVGATIRKFTEEDARLLALFASQAASTVQSAHLFDQTQRRLRETMLLNRIIAAASSALEPKAVLTTLCEELAHALQLPQAGFALLSPDRTHLTVLAEYRSEGRPSALGAVIPVSGNRATQYAIEHRTPVAVSEAQTDERQAVIHALEKRLGIASLLIVPLVSRDQVIGTLGLVASEHREFTAEEVALAEHGTAAAGQAFENAQLYSALVQELAERKRYELIVNTSDELMTLINQERRYEAVNAAYASAHGQAPEAIIGRTVADVWGEERYQRVIKPHLDRCFAGEVERYQAWFEFDGLSPRYFDVTCYPYSAPDGTVAQVVVVSHDITGLERTEEALRESEARFYSAFEDAAIGMALVALDGRWLKVNRALCELTGYAESELLSKTFQDLTHPDDLETDLAYVRQMLAGEISTYQLEKRYFHKLGQVLWVLLSVSLVQDDQGQPLYFISQIQDITQRKRAEEDLRESGERYRELFAAAHRQAQELALLDRVRTALARELELPAILRTVVEAIAETFGYTQVSLYLLQSDRLVLQHQVGYHRVIAEIPLTQGICGRVVQDGQPVLLEEVSSDPAFLGAIAGITSEVCVPLFDQGRAVGVLNVESIHGVRLTEADLRLMTSLGEHVSVAIGQARLYAEVQRLAITDDLTGLFNRRHLFELGEAEFNRARRLGHPLSAIMLDIDHFKQVNDRWGHAIGDQVLRALAERCRKNFRQFDIVGRYGGEEFAILLPQTDLESAVEIAERLRRGTEEAPVRTARENIRITISLGVAVATGDTLDFVALLDDADQAMYAAKQAGRNRVAVGESGVRPCGCSVISTST
jgi:diguanylate cyclase (GGDEF)-like protein/PAS domain S-box-containing protein